MVCTSYGYRATVWGLVCILVWNVTLGLGDKIIHTFLCGSCIKKEHLCVNLGSLLMLVVTSLIEVA
jgi:hypothetical protein